ncbi:MAG: hypothetical protein COA78_17710 [Blastopirellula sp.]|nr:MAG: hypothetical protein COA78_17710 [Blastopirellula sp.]
MRTLFILVTVLCVLLVPVSVKLYQARQQRLAVEWILENGGYVTYDSDLSTGEFSVSDVITGNRWLRSVLGNDFFDAVVIVHITNLSDIDISPLTQLQSLKTVVLADPQNVDLSPLDSLNQLDSIDFHFTSETSFTAKNIAELSKSGYPLNVMITGPSIDDLTPIQQLNNIRWLGISDSQVTDLAPLTHLTQLEDLTIFQTPVKDYSPLKDIKSLERFSADQCNISDLSSFSGLTQLHFLTLREPNVTDLTPLAKLVTLRGISLRSLKAKDLSPLDKLPNLRHLSLSVMQVPKAEIERLEKALPNCAISN